MMVPYPLIFLPVPVLPESLWNLLPTTLYLIPMNTEKETLNLANQFRRLGIAVVIEMNNKKIKKCFEWANKQAIPFVSVIGEDEMKDQKLKIKKI